MRILLASFVLFLSSATHAATVDFDSDVSTPLPGVFESKGFRFTVEDGLILNVGGSNRLAVFDAPGCLLSCTISVESLTGNPFNLDSMDLLKSGAGTNFVIFGLYSGGGDNARVVAADVSFETFTGWDNLSELRISVSPETDSFFALDNFTATVVPIPAAAWLFGSGLMALGWLRRKPAT